MGAATAVDNSVPVESGKGVTLDYDIVDSYFSGGNLASGLFNARAFSPWGVLSSGLITRAGQVPFSQTTEPAIRLDTTYTYSASINCGATGWAISSRAASPGPCRAHRRPETARISRCVPIS